MPSWHQVVSAARRRATGRRRRFYIYCDEFQNYVTEEFARALEEMRKFQVSFVLAHQHLGQIERAGEWIMQSVISQPGVRVVFHPGGRADAEVWAKELFTGTSEVTGARVKDELYRTFFEPKIVWEDVESVTESDMSGGSDSWSDDGFSSGSSDSHTTSVTQSRIPVTHHKERRELASRTYRSLDEEWERATGWLMKQPDRHALLHIRGRRPMRMVTPEVEAPGLTARFEELRAEKALARYSRPRAEVEAEIAARRARVDPQTGPKRTMRRRGPDFPLHKGLVEQE